MLPQQAIMVKENRIETQAHMFAASCAIAPGALNAGDVRIAE
jgi:hypothetical protein